MGREIYDFTVVVAVLLVVITGFRGTEAANYTVGDSTGWETPSSSSFYSDWASGITFNVNDTLVFNFVTGVHDVAIVTSQNQYENCNAGTNILTTGPATVPLNSTGTHYFFCTISNHCSRGQKLSVTVGSTSSTPSAPTPSGSPSPPGTTSPPPPPSGSGAGLDSSVASMFVFVVMGYVALYY